MVVFRIVCVLLISGLLFACDDDTSGAPGTDTTPGLDTQASDSTTTDTALPEDTAPGEDATDTAVADTGPADTGTADVDQDTPPPQASVEGVFLWRGLEHEWLRTVVGFKVPHRISQLWSFIDAEETQPDDSSSALFHFAQSTGVDGNYMKPRGVYSLIQSPDLTVVRTQHTFTFTDDVDETQAYPQARSDLSQTFTLPLDQLGDNPAAYEVVLRGLRLDIQCDDAKQPSGEPCNSNGMWPFRFDVSVGDCTDDGTTLSCPVEAHVYRAWTPNRGGLPPFEEKPLNDKLDFELELLLTVIAGPSTAFATTTGEPVVTDRVSARQNAPVTTTQTLTGTGGGAYPVAATAFKRFGFRFRKTGTADKNNHLGRYIGILNFQLDDTAYDRQTGALDVEHTTQIWIPDTVVDTDVVYTSQVALLQFGPGALSRSNRTATGSLCRNSSPQAPALTRWEKCDEPDKAPEQTEDAVEISGP